MCTTAWEVTPFSILPHPPPPPLLHAVRWERTLIGGCPTISLLVQGPPPFPLLYDVHRVRTLQFDGG